MGIITYIYIMSIDPKTARDALNNVNIRLKLAVSDLLTRAPGVDIEDKTKDQMEILDMIFRELVANGAKGNMECYMAALKAQNQYRQMIGALNTLKKQQPNTGLPKNPWRTNY